MICIPYSVQYRVTVRASPAGGVEGVSGVFWKTGTPGPRRMPCASTQHRRPITVHLSREGKWDQRANVAFIAFTVRCSCNWSNNNDKAGGKWKDLELE